LGWDVAGIAETSPGADDHSVGARAQREGRILLTFDKDFGELSLTTPLSARCGVVLCRLPLSPPVDTAVRIERILASRDDWAGAFSVVERDRIRMRRIGR